MKTCALAALIVPAMLITGCQSPAPLVLAPVGPPPEIEHVHAPAGSLMVYTAYDQSPYVDPIGRLRYTGYRIFSNDGTLLKTVVNNSAPAGPAVVELTPGKYKIDARANGYGAVTVPVVIAADQTTVVRLDGGARWAEGIPDNPVRLPRGEIAGWSVAQTETNRSPALSHASDNRNAALAR